MSRRTTLPTPLLAVPLLAAAVAVGLLPALAGTASARTTDQSFWVTANESVTILGHGFGHGHGMSQYGAQGAAHQGLTAKQILAFYYPGTVNRTMPASSVRVLISGDTDNDTTVLASSGLRLTDLGTGTTYALPALAGVTQWRVRVVGGREQVSFLRTAWTGYKPGGRATLAGDGQFSGPGPLTLVTAAGRRVYRGALRLAGATRTATRRSTINVVSMDDYVKGVVPREMPASWLPAAVQAQAVAARTYATWTRDQTPSRYYQICDTTSCQVYGGVTDEDPRSNAAVDATRAQILTYQGVAAFTQFGSSSGGVTSSGGVAYLPTKVDPYDGLSGNPVHTWTATVSAKVLERRYPGLGRLQRIRVVSRTGVGDWGGRVGSVVLDGSKRDRTISGDTLRSIYGLRSTYLTIAPTRIIARWTAIGGARAAVGVPTAREHAARGGVVQNFTRGRIYLPSGAASASELYGPVFTAYVGTRGPEGRLGLPTGPVRAESGGSWAPFQRGAIHYASATRKATITYR